MSSRPNVVLILNDDMGFSDIGCYGGEVRTPHLDRLAGGGVRMTQFYNTARCCPSRASMLTGLYPQQADVGHMVSDDGVDGYLGDLNADTVTIAEAMKHAGYATYMSGKWHVTRHVDGPKHNWPRQRGFDRFYGIITGASDYFDPSTLTRENEPVETPGGEYYFTDAISDEAVGYIRGHAEARPDTPFFAYVAYTAPHWPLHAPAEDIERYAGRFDRGWDVLRAERVERMVEMGIIDPDWRLTDRDPSQPEWEAAEDKAWQAKRMEVYAAQIDRMDQGIGRIVEALEQTGQLDNTLILFLADNGGCAEELGPRSDEWIAGHYGQTITRDGRRIRYGNDPAIMPGGQDTYQSCGIPWANVSNTPFRLYKHWVHEGGIATPLIAHWPAGISDSGALRHQPGQLPDIMATCLDVAGAVYPEQYAGHEVQPLEGFSLRPIFADRASDREVLYWEHEGNKAVRRGKWKLVCRHPGGWELYDIEADRTETADLAGENPDVVAELAGLYDAWADRAGVMSWAQLQQLRRKRREARR